MSSILITLGVLGLMASLVLLVINVIRKKPKKKMIIAALIFFVISGIGFELEPEEENIAAEDEEVEVEVEEREPEEEKVSEAEEPKKEELETQKVEESNISQNDLEEASLALMRQNFEGMARVDYNNEFKSYNLLPTDDDLIMELNLLVSGNPNVVDGWESLVGGIKDLSGALRDNLGSGYAINLLNPANTDNVLLTCIDGVVFYNVIDDL